RQEGARSEAPARRRTGRRRAGAGGSSPACVTLDAVRCQTESNSQPILRAAASDGFVGRFGGNNENVCQTGLEPPLPTCPRDGGDRRFPAFSSPLPDVPTFLSEVSRVAAIR